MDWINNIIKAEHASYEPPFLRTILAEHGDIVTFLPCKDTRQCFVRYSTSQGAESAYNNQNSVQGLRVSTVSQDSTLLNQYLTWHSSRFVEDYSKRWCVPKQEQKPPSRPRKRAYSEVETQKTKDHMPETKQTKREETAPRSSAVDQKVAFMPMTSERAQTKTQVKAAPAKGISRAEAPTPSYRKLQIRTVPSKETCPPRASTRQSILNSPYSPKTKIAYPKRLPRAEESTPSSSCRKLRPKADRSQGLDSDRSVLLKETRASSKQSLVTSLSPSKTRRALPGEMHPEEMHRAKALTPPPSCRKPQAKTDSLHGVNSDLSVPKETSESESATRTYPPLSNTVTEDPVILKHERSEKQPDVHREDAAETSIVAIPSSFSMETKIELKVAGEKFMYDLKKLEDDPKAIIGLLKLASAERGHWMIVAAFYRRRGNAQAATKLMKELLEVLKRHDVHEDNMKPVYLMLSGCEADLAKAEKETTTTHYLNAQTWLQKVYGTCNHGDNRSGIKVRPEKPAQEDGKRESAARSSRKLGDRIENRPKRPYDVNKRRKYSHFNYYR